MSRKTRNANHKAACSFNGKKPDRHCTPTPPSPCKRHKKKKCRQPLRKVRSATLFTEQLYAGIPAHDEWEPVPVQDTSLKSVYSYAIINRGSNAAEVKIEISPNEINFISDLQESVAPSSTKVIIPIRFMKYTRVSVKSQETGQPTSVDVYFQAQENIR